MEVVAQGGPMAGMSGDPAEVVLFWVFAVMALGAGLAVVTMRNIVHGALMLVVNLLAIAGLYVTLESPFLGIIQVLVYGGAIMVLFLFVIMLLGVDRDDLLVASHVPTRILAVVGCALLAGALLFAFVGPYTGEASVCNQPEVSSSTRAIACEGLAEAVEGHERGSVGLLGELMFTRYTFAFELAALLLVVATIGATLLGRRRDLAPDDPLPESAGPLDDAEGIRPGGDPVAHPRGAGPAPDAPEGALEGSTRPAERDLPARPHDREG